MAKLFKSNLPKVISKANKDISTIIENDIAAESKILKSLVDKVLEANLEVKKKNNARITETKRRISELDEEIDRLNISIDDVDRDTAIRQLNEMVETENNIFIARQEVRFFDNEKAAEKIEYIEEIYASLLESIQQMYGFEERYHTILKDSNDLLFNKQIEITLEVIDIMHKLFDEKALFVDDELAKVKGLEARINEKENTFNQYFNDAIEEQIQLKASSTSLFTETDDELATNEKVEIEHNKTILDLTEAIEELKVQHVENMKQIKEELQIYENNVKVTLENRDKQSLEEERIKEKQRQEEMKNIRLLIIDSEKKGNYSKMTKLMKQLEKIEKEKPGETTRKVEKDFENMTKKNRVKSVNTQFAAEKKYVQDLNKLEYELALENIRYEEAKILYRIKADYEGLQGDININKEQIRVMKELLHEKQKAMTEIYDLKLQLRKDELVIMRENELSELSFISQFKDLLVSLKIIEHKRLTNLIEDINTYDAMKQEQVYNIKKAIQDIKLNQELSSIDKLILKKRNDAVILSEKIKEEATSDIIYQESLIDIAKKELDLQLVKVKSLYENEKSLAEDQFNRINLGLKVNDAFVKTTLENQMLFAEQQIKCAESEFEIRVESINLTRDQELSYATKKIDRYKHKYEYDKAKIQKELDDKLEDLNYKLLLFTDEKDNKSIQAKIDQLKTTYGAMIDEIDHVEQQDPEIIRYQAVIDDANKRADEAIAEALSLKEQTISSFETLHAQTKEKYDQIIETDQTEDTRGIMPVVNNQAIGNANLRLQKAIKEAEKLYEDKIAEPTKIIAKQKEFLSQVVTSDETDEYIESQKNKKRDLIKAHKEVIDQLEENKVKALKPIEDMLFKAKLIQEKELEQIRESMYDNPSYRSEQEIQKDYDALFVKEENIYTKYKKDVADYVLKLLQQYDPLHKQIQNNIKKTLKTYKKYIRYASRGLNSKKKDLHKKYTKLLKKELSVVDSKYKELLSEI